VTNSFATLPPKCGPFLTTLPPHNSVWHKVSHPTHHPVLLASSVEKWPGEHQWHWRWPMGRILQRSPHLCARSREIHSERRSTKKKGGGEWILCHRMPPIWHSLLPVKMSDDEFTEREVYFSLNGTTNVNLVVQMIFFDPFIKCSQCWFHQWEGRSQNCVMKKYLVLLSNHNVIGRNDLTGVKKLV